MTLEPNVDVSDIGFARPLLARGLRRPNPIPAFSSGPGAVAEFDLDHALHSNSGPTLGFDPDPVLNLISVLVLNSAPRLAINSDTAQGSNLYTARTNANIKIRFTNSISREPLRLNSFETTASPPRRRGRRADFLYLTMQRTFCT
ncbi:hypothetical protein EVAR_80973_1 [Eumeta japonica]|uniref:Uncharacterized protein n=1 Tax=Eumeta variegata TaxID=151549 RepID=A0A4C1WP07_EUMVA|nr:hypothetical protein EVAR_80973_1 [Eumeta japonica]